MNHCEREMYNFAYAVTRSAGARLRWDREHSAIEVREKSTQMDLVTQQDLLIERYLTEAILGKYPDHAVLAEECHHDGVLTREMYTWIIDPIDGTMNYYRFARNYAISIALYMGEVPVFGLVYDAAGDIMYSVGAREKPEINGVSLEPLPYSETTLNKAVVGMSLRTMKELNDLGTDTFHLLSKAQGYRYLGCASLELCKVAKGEYDLFISSNVYLWDIAAARMFVDRCGGVVIACKKATDESCTEKLFAAAFRSRKLWQETLELLPAGVIHWLQNIKM